jgi:hypothetical protein
VRFEMLVCERASVWGWRQIDSAAARHSRTTCYPTDGPSAHPHPQAERWQASTEPEAFGGMFLRDRAQRRARGRAMGTLATQ